MHTTSPGKRTRSHGKDPATAILSPRPDGTIGALSSNGTDIYTVRLAPLSCSCPGFVGHGKCYHSTAARLRYATRCAWCGALGVDVSTYSNQSDTDAALALCARCRGGR